MTPELTPKERTANQQAIAAAIIDVCKKRNIPPPDAIDGTIMSATQILLGMNTQGYDLAQSAAIVAGIAKEQADYAVEYTKTQN